MDRALMLSFTAVRNDLYADIFGAKKFDLHKFEKPIADGCIEYDFPCMMLYKI